MNSSITTQIKPVRSRGLTPALLVTAVLSLGAVSSAWSGQGNAIVSPNESYRGKDYSEWSARWWQWNLELPLAGHPAVDSPDFDVRSGQRGSVWFLGGPFGTLERSVTIPASKALFFPLFNAEASSLEAPDSGFHGDTEAEQREVARYWADHIVSVFCIIDNEEVENLADFRVVSPQFQFNAPTPWIFGDTGGQGTAVGDGYYVMLRPMSKGAHTIRFGGRSHFTLAEDGFDGDFPIDTTYHVTVE